jgi:hypothetical protein
MEPDEFRVDRIAFSVVCLEEADDDLEYWLSKTPQERLRGVELSRQALYGYRDPAPRLQRVLTIAQLKRG